MKGARFFILFLFAVFSVSAFCFFGAGTAKAGGNVYGWAWSLNIGWISFNNLGTTDYQNNPVPAGGGSVDYGVNIGTNGNLSGYAWSENIGWINLNPAGPYPETPSYSSCVDLPVSGQACDGAGDYTVTGWARACSVFRSTCSITTSKFCNVNSDCPTGETCATRCSGTLDPNRGNWDGWIKFHHISIDTSVSPAEFHYWVWGGSDDSSDAANSEAVIGWGTFNCADVKVCSTSNQFCGADSDCPSGQTCITRNGCSLVSRYKIVTTLSFACTNDSQCPSDEKCIAGICTPIQKPEAIQVGLGQSLNTPQPGSPPLPPLTAETFTADACTSTIYFGWTYIDASNNPETRFDFQIDNNSDFSSPEVKRSYCNINLGNPPSVNNQTVQILSSPSSSIHTYCAGAPDEYNANTPDALSYNTKYYWRVKVYDNQGLDSGWANGPSDGFTTPAHAYPKPVFTFSPASPITLVNKSAPVSFTDSSICYDANNIPAPPPSCKTYNWDFGDKSASVDENPSHTYTSASTYIVKLTVCDNDANCCSTTNNVTTKNPLNVPQWQEISPF